jgi:hypothetical protein
VIEDTDELLERFRRHVEKEFSSAVKEEYIPTNDCEIDGRFFLSEDGKTVYIYEYTGATS